MSADRLRAKPERLELLGPLLMLVGMAPLGMLPGLPSFGRDGGSGMTQRWLGPASDWLPVAIGVWMC